MWIAAALVCALALTVLLASPMPGGLYIAAGPFGISFGIANGVELAVILLLRSASNHLGRDSGLFTAVTTTPYVLVPLLASLIVGDDAAPGLITLLTLAVILTRAVGVLVATTAMIARRRERQYA